MEELINTINKAHNPDLASNNMVYQIWEDGEVTLQKAGNLLWTRGLHIIYPAINGLNINYTKMPIKYHYHGYAFVSEHDIIIIRELMRNLVEKK